MRGLTQDELDKVYGGKGGSKSASVEAASQPEAVEAPQASVQRAASSRR